MLIDAAPAEVARWLPRSRSASCRRPSDGSSTRLRASTANPGWYAGRLAVLPYAFHVHGSPELRQATADLGRRLLASAAPDSGTRGISPAIKAAIGLIERSRPTRAPHR